MRKPETRLQKHIRNVLTRDFGGKWWKTHGSIYTPAGWPDLMGVVDGKFFALEVKIPGQQEQGLTKLQSFHLQDFARHGAITGVYTTVEEAQELVASTLLR